MTDWKRTERKVAALLGGVRVPVSGRARGDAPDVAHARLSIEVKSRKELPAWLMDAMVQAEAGYTCPPHACSLWRKHGGSPWRRLR
jgi:hypothetical protein